jgi:DNA polymerase-3 subunit beta
MHFVVNKNEFYESLRNVVNIIEAKATYPVLQNVFIDVTDTELVLKATDLDTYIEKHLSLVSKKKTGKVIVSGKKLLEAVSQLTAQELTFSLRETNLILEADGSTSKFLTLDPEEFPEIPEIPQGNKITLNQSLLKECFDYTGFAVSKDTSRPAMCGVFLKVTAQDLVMVATDGYRLGYVKRKGNFEAEIEAIITPKVFTIFPKNEEEMAVTYDSSKIGFTFPKTVIVSRLIEGPYPDYQRIIPSRYEYRLEASSVEFISALRRAQVFANPISKLIIFSLTSKKCTVFAETAEIGETTHVFAAHYQGEDLKVGFNVAYLLEIVNALNTDKIAMEFTTPQAAAVIKPAVPNEETELIYLLMPIRID